MRSRHARSAQPLIGKDTAILFGQNGLPWWYFYEHGGPYDGGALKASIPAAKYGGGSGPSVRWAA